MKCIDLNNPCFYKLLVRIPLTVCIDGTVDGALSNSVVRVERRIMRFEELNKVAPLSIGRIEPVLCTRVYVTRDGALIVAFGSVPLDIHIYFNKPIWKILGFESLEDMQRELVWSWKNRLLLGKIEKLYWETGGFIEEMRKREVENNHTMVALGRPWINASIAAYSAIFVLNSKPFADHWLLQEKSRMIGVLSFDWYARPNSMVLIPVCEYEYV